MLGTLFRTGDRYAISSADATGRAETNYDQAFATTRQKVRDAIDSRLKQVTAEGNLRKVEELQAARAAFLSTGRIGTATTDATIRGAVTQYETIMKGAKVRLLRAYDEAVRDYTKSSQIERAQEVKGVRDKFASSPEMSRTPQARSAQPPLRKFTSISEVFDAVPQSLRSSTPQTWTDLQVAAGNKISYADFSRDGNTVRMNVNLSDCDFTK
ncbi:MAG TPA: hypothetical protein VK797_10040 [Tepidisphaeraceae bacterium]|jgi:hypothetical protein|nr:hypothetical protein [Tepidisphaeraceae bacterium]